MMMNLILLLLCILFLPGFKFIHAFSIGVWFDSNKKHSDDDEKVVS